MWSNLFKPFVFMVAVTLLGCSKESNSGSANGAEIVTINGESYQLVSETNVSSSVDGGNWLASSGGEVYVDSISNVGDSTTLFMTATDGCFSAEQIKGVAIVTQQEAVIQLSYMLPTTTLNDVREGKDFTCAGACRMEIFQGEELLLSEWIREEDEWNDIQFFFRTKSTNEVKIRFVVGSRKGLWIDDMKLFQKL